MKHLNKVAWLALAAVFALGVMPPMLASTVKWYDHDETGAETRRVKTVSDKNPLPVRDALVWSGVVNETFETCNTDGGVPIAELDDVTVALQDNGGSFTDETTDANDAGTNDVAPFPDPAAEDDAFYIGAADQFTGIKFDIGTQGSTVLTVTWEYYDGVDADGWATLTFMRQDVADFDEATGLHWNTFDPPSGWIETVVDGTRAYYVRARVSAFTSTTTQALLDEASVTTLGTDTAKQVTIRADSDETEDVWCIPLRDAGATDVDADNGQIIDAGTGVYTFPVDRSSAEIVCCGDGGDVDFAASLYDQGI